MRSLLAGLLLLAASALPIVAHADTVDLFTLTGGGNTYTWTLPSPVNFSVRNEPQFVPTFPITLVTNGVPASSTVTFEFGHVANLIVGGLAIINIPSVLNPTFLTDDGTVSTFTGTFDLGTFNGLVQVFSNNSVTNVPYTLTIAPQQDASPTPEPSSLLLLATGLAAALVPLRRRLSTL